MKAAAAVAVEEIINPETLHVPSGYAAYRDGLWLVELDDGTFVPAFGDTVFRRPIGGAA